MPPNQMKSPHVGMTVSLYDRILAALRRNGQEGLRPVQLSILLGSSSGTITTILAGSLKQGLVTRRKGGGGVIYSITKKGMEKPHGNGEK